MRKGLRGNNSLLVDPGECLLAKTSLCRKRVLQLSRGDVSIESVKGQCLCSLGLPEMTSGEESFNQYTSHLFPTIFSLFSDKQTS
jgi:hypothetical protein